MSLSFGAVVAGVWATAVSLIVTEAVAVAEQQVIEFAAGWKADIDVYSTACAGWGGDQPSWKSFPVFSAWLNAEGGWRVKLWTTAYNELYSYNKRVERKVGPKNMRASLSISTNNEFLEFMENMGSKGTSPVR